MCPPRYKLQLAVQEFCKLHEPKINNSAMANLIFQLWLKDIRVHVEDWNLMERDAMQLVKDFTAQCACDEVEFYKGMVVEEQKTFEGLIQHLQNAFQSGETISNLISIFMVRPRKRTSLRTYLQMILRYSPEK